jgi:FADH2 O2-dependent halogenase
VTADTDLAIVGSGFGGSLLAMIARRLGYRVTLLERGQHPRFAIGESASPLAGILIEQLADRYDLPRVRPLSAFGTWQRTYPLVVCGLKRGFTYFKHETGRPYKADEARTNQLLVAASPSDELSDTHWLRSDVDQFLVNEAIALGVDYRDLVELESVEWEPSGAPTLKGTRRGQTLHVRAQFVVDASGPRGFLSRALGIADRGFDGYPATQALFSHFVDVPRCDELDDFRIPDREIGPPYPMDDAALHHVFDGGWMWVLRFGNGVTSAGIAVEDWLADELKVAEGEPAWRRFLARYPSIATQFADARAIRAFTWMPRMAYRAAECAGDRWAMLPSAAAFIDPLFSTGIPLTLLGIERLAGLLGDVGVPSMSLRPGATRLYADATLADADRTASFIAGSYAGFRDFPMFASYSMFYFAAASFSEMARRLDSPKTPRGFLCGDSDAFTSAMTRLAPASPGVLRERYDGQVAAAIADWNVAGLCDAEKQNWYGVDLDDTVGSAEKLGLTRKQVRERLGLFACSPSPKP